ncbi:unnamed protein product [Moneuplotes crassus]|uniref:Uncharacterized protein n=1 Tax=Euplotes crassus TaxID=5936 RepID=A0AAD1XTG0_EUPCR|nr:unnamed protein product [Moneuplotes crassus]
MSQAGVLSGLGLKMGCLGYLGDLVDFRGGMYRVGDGCCRGYWESALYYGGDRVMKWGSCDLASIAILREIFRLSLCFISCKPNAVFFTGKI